MSPPRISIVTATYNRAEVLRLTIESVLASRFADWEMIIVGDACTDHSEAVARSFGDPRISFTNLPVNTGEQSVANNAGVALARAPFVAFLNHDDLWVPDHLDLALEQLEAESADIVSTLTVAVDRAGRHNLLGCCQPLYSPRFFVPASSWLIRRETLAATGPWRKATELHMIPSAEWLFPAWRRGARIVSLQRATVLAVQSGDRQGSYALNDHRENAEWAARLRHDPALMETLLTRIASRQLAEAGSAGWAAQLKRAAKNSIVSAAIGMGVHPHALRQAVLYRRKGGFIDTLRVHRGLTLSIGNPVSQSERLASWVVQGAVKDAQTVNANWTAVQQPLIDGVEVHEMRSVPKRGGYLTEILRRDWLGENREVDQVFQSVLDPQSISGWHAHAYTTDRLFVSYGMARVVLYDMRPNSPTRGMINEFRIGTVRPALVVVPPQIWHGVQAISTGPTILLNLVDAAYDYAAPDHWRVPHDSPEIPFRF